MNATGVFLSFVPQSAKGQKVGKTKSHCLFIEPLSLNQVMEKRMNERYFVICQEEDGALVFATHGYFATRSWAESHARSAAKQRRNPRVVVATEDFYKWDSLKVCVRVARDRRLQDLTPAVCFRHLRSWRRLTMHPATPIRTSVKLAGSRIGAGSASVQVALRSVHTVARSADLPPPGP